VPHVHIKHFPTPLDPAREAALVAAVTQAVVDAFGVPPGTVSIATEPVAPAAWQETVYAPEIVGRRDLLRKTPDY
jgi:4-oxalocrotonate tautomerase